MIVCTVKAANKHRAKRNASELYPTKLNLSKILLLLHDEDERLLHHHILSDQTMNYIWFFCGLEPSADV